MEMKGKDKDNDNIKDRGKDEDESHRDTVTHHGSLRMSKMKTRQETRILTLDRTERK